MCTCSSVCVNELRCYAYLTRITSWFNDAGVAQLVERFTCNEDVGGSTPLAGSIFCLFPWKGISEERFLSLSDQLVKSQPGHFR